MIAAKRAPICPSDAPLCQAVDPRDGVFVFVISSGKRFQGGIKVRRFLIIDGKVRRLDLPQLKACLKNDAGQSHSAEGGPERVGILLPRAAQDFSGGEQQIKAFDELGDRPIAMMIFPMNIGGDHPAQCYVLGARRDSREKTARNENFEDLFE